MSPEPTETVIGLVSDSHIPDRRSRLHPDMLARLRDEQASMILHMGDISLPSVIKQLEEIAPVYAVKGNYDFFFRPALPMTRIVEVGDIRIGMTHGHGGLAKYMEDKFMFIIGRYKNVEFFAQRAESLLPEDVDIVCFGHNHFPSVNNKGTKLIINPGSCSTHLYFQKEDPSFGLLRISEKNIKTEIVKLDRNRF